MGNRDGVEAGDTARPEVRRDHVFAEVELRSTAPDGASGINQQSAALGHY
ncbi:MAG: hypothetical protein WBP65_05220 [Candidatus Sulfotelmatobacter sp.]